VIFEEKSVAAVGSALEQAGKGPKVKFAIIIPI